MHAEAEEAEYEPAAQTLHADIPTAAVNLPALQGVETVFPVVSENEPIAACMHALAPEVDE